MPPKFLDNLKSQAEENPVLAVAAVAAALSSISKLVYAAAWNKEVNRRNRIARRK